MTGFGNPQFDDHAGKAGGKATYMSRAQGLLTSAQALANKGQAALQMKRSASLMRDDVRPLVLAGWQLCTCIWRPVCLIFTVATRTSGSLGYAEQHRLLRAPYSLSSARHSLPRLRKSCSCRTKATAAERTHTTRCQLPRPTRRGRCLPVWVPLSYPAVRLRTRQLLPPAQVQPVVLCRLMSAAPAGTWWLPPSSRKPPLLFSLQLPMCVRACVRACVRVCVCVCAFVHRCVHACVRVADGYILAGAGEEARVVEAFCTPGGLRAQPSRDDCRVFVESLGHLNGDAIVQELEAKMVRLHLHWHAAACWLAADWQACSCQCSDKAQLSGKQSTLAGVCLQSGAVCRAMPRGRQHSGLCVRWKPSFRWATRRSAAASLSIFR